MSKSVTTLAGAMAVLLWFTGPAWAPRDCAGCVITKPGSKSVVNPEAMKARKGIKGTQNRPAQKSQPGK